jgi:hypothetical protein
LFWASHASKVCSQRTSDLNAARAAEAVIQVTLGLLSKSSAPVKNRGCGIPRKNFQNFQKIFSNIPIDLLGDEPSPVKTRPRVALGFQNKACFPAGKGFCLQL